jgi:hypothetical protein
MLRSAILWLRDRVADFIPSKFLLNDCLDKGFVIFAILVHAIVFGAVPENAIDRSAWDRSYWHPARPTLDRTL